MTTPITPALRALALVLTIVIVAACKPQTREFQLRHGQVIQTDEAKSTIVVRHNEIPGLMPGMTMEYKIKDRKAFADLQAGDIIDANVVVLRDGSDFWLDSVHVTDASARTAAERAARMLKPGQAIPDVELVDQDGKPIRLSDFKGKALLVTFIYTRCPLPEFCPALSSQFAKVHESLAKTPAAYARTHLLTISFDPKNDTPNVLRTYGLGYLHGDVSGFNHWTFATPSPDALKELAEAFGLLYVEQADQIAHSINIVLIGRDGRISKYWTDVNAKDLETALRAAQAS
jgi:protein SCO1/2